jgi:hypothetical protein
MGRRLIVYADPKTGRDTTIEIKPIIKRQVDFSRRCVVLLFVSFLELMCMVGGVDVCV